ncbi:MAG: YfiR/HmsC family protein [Ignavibacteriaceae bacterium]|nr:YfiR/HmsC family protein [Ignavibacteriaceae bacterium]
MDIPIEKQFPIFIKIFTFDRNLQQRAEDGLNILIVYQKNFRTSFSAYEKIREVLRKIDINSIENIPIKYSYLDIDEFSLQSAITRDKINMIYLCPLRGVSLESITSITRDRGILSFTGVSDYVESGIAIGLELKGEKTQIIINLTAAKAERTDFSSQLLKLCKIIEE